MSKREESGYARLGVGIDSRWKGLEMGSREPIILQARPGTIRVFCKTLAGKKWAVQWWNETYNYCKESTSSSTFKVILM